MRPALGKAVGSNGTRISSCRGGQFEVTGATTVCAFAPATCSKAVHRTAAIPTLIFMQSPSKNNISIEEAEISSRLVFLTLNKVTDSRAVGCWRRAAIAAADPCD